MDCMTQEDRAMVTLAVKLMRERAEPHGSMHPLWDLINDAEAVLAGHKGLLSYDAIIESCSGQLAPKITPK